MKTKLNEVWIELKPSNIVKGEVGVFAVRKILKGWKVCPSNSDSEDFITKEELQTLSPELQEKVKKYSAWDERGYSIDPGIDFNELTTSYYFNHSCAGNLGFDNKGDFIAIRDIKKGEELSYDYGLVEADPEFKFECQCRTSECRKIITGNDRKNKDFQNRNLEYFHPDIRKLFE